MSQSRKKPITIVTGCLGSGKTTLLQHILKDETIRTSTAVIVNEYGKVGLDHHLLRKADERTVLLKGGCICCNSREDLEEELKSLLYEDESGEHPFSRVIIETTGMADPSPILFTVLTNPLLQHRYVIDCVITTVDAKNGLLHLKNNPETVKQITVADQIILTKTDITTQAEVDSVTSQIETINPACTITHAVDGVVDRSIIQGTNQREPLSFLQPPPQIHYQINDVSSISFTFKQPLDWTAFGLWLSMLLHTYGENVLRVKGLLDVGEAGPIVLNGVQHIIHPPQHLEKWPDETQHSHLIFIARDLDTSLIEHSLTTFQTFLGTSIEGCDFSSVS
ncbi:CobW family GTP-binding protein [Priestia flexa]|uniref:CobW family GTP-binding protein n=1 Tax=Priestia flexa TaxID=86664 RepID=UPI001CD547A1|nr:GTP-binding protein [Priestia flexa]MCA1203697.1 GTP-binding protein [Priestia flexa]